MKRCWRCLAGALAVAGAIGWAVQAGAETCKLELKKTADLRSGIRSGRDQQMRYMVSYASSQSFFMQIGGPEGRVAQPSGPAGAPKFSDIVKKEPAKYFSEHPFRGVAKLGSDYYGFVLDAAEPKEEEKKDGDEAKKSDDKKSDAKKDESSAETKGKSSALGKALVEATKKTKKTAVKPYARLLFDLNRNGDLTDDKVVEADADRYYGGASYYQASFPATDVTINVDGTKVDYAFRMRVYGQSQPGFTYANASLESAAYREGKITFGGKEYTVAVTDFNSNGRFGDMTTVDDKSPKGNDTVYPTPGDMVFLIDTKAKIENVSPYQVSQNDFMHYAGKVIQIDGQFHGLKISPSGDELTIDPKPIPVGHVTNPNVGYHAVVYGPEGVLKANSDASGKAPLPPGQWRLLSYTIRVSDEPGKKKEESKPGEKKDGEKKGPSLLGALRKAMTVAASESARPPRSKFSYVTAQATDKANPVTVVEGETVELPFGGPYKPVVATSYRSGKDSVGLSLTLVGSAGEVVEDMDVRGNNPPEPAFAITTADGKEVVSGKFRYG